MLTSLIVEEGKTVLSLKRDCEPKMVLNREKVLLDGGRYYYTVMSDGTVAVGRYGADGDHHSVEAALINDVFDLKGDDRLWEGKVIVNLKRYCLLNRVYKEWAEKYEFSALEPGSVTDVLADPEEDDE